MTALPVGVLMIVLAAASFWLVGAAAARVVYPPIRPLLRKIPPERRCGAVLGWCAAPAAAAVVLTAVCLAPSLASLVGLGADHCLLHDDHHAHLCLIHPGAGSLTGAGSVLVFAVLVWWSAGSARELAQAIRGWHLGRRLETFGQGEREDVRVVATRAPVAFAVGIARARIYISSELIRRLSAAQLLAVTEHEQAHVRRRDGLRKLVAGILCAGHLPAMRRWLMADLGLACEQACDAEAAARVGDSVQVAEAIVAVERLCADWRPESAAAWPFVGANVAARVEALLSEPVRLPARWAGVRLAVAGVLGLVMLAAAEPVHHRTETLLALFVR